MWAAEEIKKYQEEEREIMKDVKDWKVGEQIYSKRWKFPEHLKTNF